MLPQVLGSPASQDPIQILTVAAEAKLGAIRALLSREPHQLAIRNIAEFRSTKLRQAVPSICSERTTKFLLVVPEAPKRHFCTVDKTNDMGDPFQGTWIGSGWGLVMCTWAVLRSCQ
jgi:hypothetical protein